jgi:2-methylisocitrate lyase-like PEP mutase family enzyme
MGAGPPEGYTTDDLGDAGFSFMMFAATPLAAAANAMAALFSEIRTQDTDINYIKNNPGPYYDSVALMNAVHLQRYMDIEKRFSSEN